MTSRGILQKVPKRLSGKNIQLMDWHIAGPLYFDGVKGYLRRARISLSRVLICKLISGREKGTEAA
jgi:hypothetical protein